MSKNLYILSCNLKFKVRAEPFFKELPFLRLLVLWNFSPVSFTCISSTCILRIYVYLIKGIAIYSPLSSNIYYSNEKIQYLPQYPLSLDCISKSVLGANSGNIGETRKNNQIVFYKEGCGISDSLPSVCLHLLLPSISSKDIQNIASYLHGCPLNASHVYTFFCFN